MKNFQWIFGFLLIFLAIPVHAADLTLFGGVQNPGKLTLQSTAQPSLLDPRSFGTFGMRVSQGRVIGSEHTLAYSPNFISSDNSAFMYNSNFMVQAPLGPVRPYVTAGLGIVHIGGDSAQFITGGFLTGNKFAVNYGGGVKFKLAGPLGIQVDARGYSIPSVLEETLNVIEVSAGVVFTF